MNETALKLGCPFCEYAGPSRILGDYGDTIVIEPLAPVTDGHLLVIPKEHVEDFTEQPLVSARAMAVAALAVGRGGEWNVITSKGAAATQTVRHLHLHLVPRHEGDGLRLPWSES